MFIRFARKVYDKLLEKFKITFTGIETEIKKDDDIDISNLKDIAPAIEQLKNSRKRWASGENSKASNVSELNLDFEPSILICETVGSGFISLDGSRWNRKHTCGTMIFEDFIYGYCRFERLGANSVYYKFFTIENSNWDGNILIKFVDRMYENDDSSINFWYAFE